MQEAQAAAAAQQQAGDGAAGTAAAASAVTAAAAAAQARQQLQLRLGQGPLTVEELAGLAITAHDFEVAVGKVQPSVRREGFTTTPDVTWEDVGSLDEVRMQTG